MGPEHSSCRPERWLQLFASEGSFDEYDPQGMYQACNFIVACPSDPANYFHLLRRQLVWPFRRPLIVMTPKRTLRNPLATSPLSDILDGGSQDEFCCVLDDPYWSDNKENVRGIVLCSGEIYYELLKIRGHEEGLDGIALIRLEQLAPFPGHQLESIVKLYSNLSAAAWIQEDPSNDGAASFVRDHLLYRQSVPSLVNVPIDWISRPESAAPADGHPHKHALSRQRLLDRVFDWSKKTTI